MTIIKSSAVSTILLLSLACGDNLVEFGGNGDGDGDGDGGGDGDGDGNGDDGDGDGLPDVIATDPDDDADNVSLGKRIHATFDMPMNGGTIDEATFLVTQAGNDIAGTVTYAGATRTATFTPDDPLDLSLRYTATITTGAEASGGAALEDDYVWVFDTGACSLSPVDLGSAASFAVLAGTTVTSTGATALVGDMGVSPGDAITGFGPGTIDGETHVDNATAAAAKEDLLTAYGQVGAMSLCSETVAGNLGGRTLTPGLYHSTSSLAISSGDLTLDAEGDEDALFVFQMDESTLTTTSGRKVILSGGARSANIYWHVGSSATLGSNSVLHGTVMAADSIGLVTDATLEGRALALDAAVTMQSNDITVP